YPCASSVDQRERENVPRGMGAIAHGEVGLGYCFGGLGCTGDSVGKGGDFGEK
nr:hypothetical protein [Tanacetum cinerariifolium]